MSRYKTSSDIPGGHTWVKTTRVEQATYFKCITCGVTAFTDPTHDYETGITGKQRKYRNMSCKEVVIAKVLEA